MLYGEEISKIKMESRKIHKENNHKINNCWYKRYRCKKETHLEKDCLFRQKE